MSRAAVVVEQVWKKFRRGQIHDTLRDLIPSLVSRRLRRVPEDVLKEREFWALQDVSFEVKPGEVLGIIGPNGSGKSTMLKLLSGILRPTRGRVEVNGRLSALIEVGAGFHQDLTGRENIYLNGAILGMTKADIDRQMDAIIEFSGLEAFLDTPVKRYSSGMYARLGFSVAAHVDPEILLVDEVLSVGDMQFQKKCMEKMLAFASGGRTVVFISHNLEAVHRLCPRSVLLKYGRMVAAGPTADVITAYITPEDEPHTVAGEARLMDIRLTDERGAPPERMLPGQRLHLSFRVDCRKPYDECVLEFKVHRTTDRLPVSVYNIALSQLVPSAGRAGGSNALLAFDANLLRGSYTVSLQVLHAPQGQFIASADNCALFSVAEMDSYRGMVHLNPVLVCPEQL